MLGITYPIPNGYPVTERLERLFFAKVLDSVRFC